MQVDDVGAAAVDVGQPDPLLIERVGTVENTRAALSMANSRQPRLRPLRRQGHDGQRAVVRQPGPVRPASASGWPTSTAPAPPTSSTCTATACASTSTSRATAGAQPQPLTRLPARRRPRRRIVPTDLLGNGTACLVWSSPLPGDARRPMRYVDLMGGQKPHLLVKTVNNLGAETRVALRAVDQVLPARTSATASRGSRGCRSRCTWSSASRPTTASAATASSPATPTTTATSTARSASSAASAWSSSGTPRSSPRSRRRRRCPARQRRRRVARAAGAHQDLVPHRRLPRPRPRLRLLRRPARRHDRASTTASRA